MPMRHVAKSWKRSAKRIIPVPELGRVCRCWKRSLASCRGSFSSTSTRRLRNLRYTAPLGSFCSDSGSSLYESWVTLSLITRPMTESARSEKPRFNWASSFVLLRPCTDSSWIDIFCLDSWLTLSPKWSNIWFSWILLRFIRPFLGFSLLLLLGTFKLLDAVEESQEEVPFLERNSGFLFDL